MGSISNLLDQVDSGTLQLPEFQRGFVWNRRQICNLMRSLYRGYPVGSLLLWETDAAGAVVRGDPVQGVRLVLLDGQQRLTTLYGILRGRPPQFFDGDPELFRGLHFNLEEERFQFLSSRDDPGLTWIDVTKLFSEGAGGVLDTLRAFDRTRAATYLDRASRVRQIADRRLPAEKITGLTQQIDVVVDIFNQVNAGGTQLSKGDLALAKLCAMTPSARQRTRDHLAYWLNAGYKFSPDWLLRNITAVATGRATFSSLETVGCGEFERALSVTPGYVDYILKVLADTLGMDHDKALPGKSWFPVMCRLLDRSQGQFRTGEERAAALRWCVFSSLRGRYNASVETIIGRDLAVVDRDGLDGLVAELEHWLDGHLELSPEDFEGVYSRSRAAPLLYAICRQAESDSDDETAADRRRSVRYLFPKSELRAIGFPPQYVNAVANCCYDSSGILDEYIGASPASYLTEVETRMPGFLKDHCIPGDPELWRLEAYEEFLARRRGLLSTAAGSLLNGPLESGPTRRGP